MFYEIKKNDPVLVDSTVNKLPTLLTVKVTSVGKRFFYAGGKAYSKKTGCEFKHMKRKAYPMSYLLENEKKKLQLFPPKVFNVSLVDNTIHFKLLQTKKRILREKDMLHLLAEYLKTLNPGVNYIFSVGHIFENADQDEVLNMFKIALPDADVCFEILPKADQHEELFAQFKITQAPLVAELKLLHLTFVGDSKGSSLLVCSAEYAKFVDLGLTAMEAFNLKVTDVSFRRLVDSTQLESLTAVSKSWVEHTPIGLTTSYASQFLCEVNASCSK